MFTPWNLRNLRPAPRRDEDVLGGKALAIDLDLMRISQARMPFMQRHTTVNQQVAVDAIEAIDLAIFIGDQSGPIKIRLAQ